ERGYEIITDILEVSLKAIEGCLCYEGCPSCIQSPKCGNHNEPLDKHAAIMILHGLLGKSPYVPPKSKPENNREIEWYKKGVEFNNIGKYNDAIECYKKALEINPKNEKTWNNIGSVYFKLKMYLEALKSYEKAIEIRPSNDMISKNLRKARQVLKRA
ncbi:MAG TPA: tetratricopeptide repeat protein, partial [Candidatus Methanoperedens sp.]|nr:tetratricopeptide repeat protein [Candidatus Methanoperedens sp.]